MSTGLATRMKPQHPHDGRQRKEGPPILETIQRFAPRPYKAQANPKSRYKMLCPIPGHDDHSPSFVVNADQTFAICWSRCGGFNRRKLYQVLSGQAAYNPPPQPSKPTQNTSASKPKSSTNPRPTGCTLADLVQAKGLDLEFVRGLGWKDGFYPRSKIKAVIMPYLTQDGEVWGYRYRVNLTGNPKYWWERGATLIPYGMADLWRAEAEGYVVIVEGETDQATLQHAGIPALGIPGSLTWRPEWMVPLNGVKEIYVWVEPGAPDTNDQWQRTAGQKMADKIGESMPRIKLIRHAGGIKDPNELAQKLGDREIFATAMRNIMAEATPWAPREVAETRQQPRDVSESDEYTERTGSAMVEPAPDRPYSYMDYAPFRGLSCEQQVHAYLRTKAMEKALATGDPPRESRIASLQAHRRLLTKLLPFKNADLSPLLPEGGKVCISMENPNLFITTERLLELVALNNLDKDDEGNPSPLWKSLYSCGWGRHFSCKTAGADHGKQKPGKHSCRNPLHIECHSDLARELCGVTLPDLEGDSRYTALILEADYPLGDSWETTLSGLVSSWTSLLVKLSRRKSFKGGKLLLRAMPIYYDAAGAHVHYKLLLQTDSQAEVEMASRILEGIGAKVVDIRQWGKGDTAALQAVEFTMGHLIGIDGALPIETQARILYDHYMATNGKQIFCTLGQLRKLIDAMPEREPLVCEVCGDGVKEILEPPVERGQGLTSPTSPNYIWQNTT